MIFEVDSCDEGDEVAMVTPEVNGCDEVVILILKFEFVDCVLWYLKFILKFWMNKQMQS